MNGWASRPHSRATLPVVIAVAAMLLVSCSPSTPTTPAASSPAPVVVDSPSSPSTTGSPPSAFAEPSSVDRIEAAEQAGAIDHVTALVYELDAALDYPSLPSSYRSSNPGALEATTILAELAARLDTLTPDLRAKVAPFLLRPTDPASFWQRTGKSARSAGSIRLAADTAITGAIDYGFVDAAKTNVRVWYATPLGATEQQLAQQLANEIDSSEMWAKERTAMLGREPCSDSQLTSNGGDGRLDIYLVYPGTGLDWQGRTDSLLTTADNPGEAVANGVTIPDGEGQLLTVGGRHCPVATHIILNAARDLVHLKSTAAHELFHAFQFAFQGVLQADRFWWEEATAAWATDLVYPALNFEQDYLDTYWSKRTGPEGPIDKFVRGGLDQYAAYILPFYLVQTSGDPTGTIVGRLWTASEAQAPIEALAALGAWTDKFKEFALWNWNRDEADQYRDGAVSIPLAKLSQRTTCMDAHDTGAGTGTGKSDCILKVGPKDLAVRLDKASVQYFEGTPDIPVVEKLRFDLSALGDRASLAVQAIITTWKGDVSVEDWTGRAERSFCVAADDLAKVVLVVSNSSTEQSLGGTIRIEPLATGCTGWIGTVTSTYDWHIAEFKGTGTTTVTGIWEPAPPNTPVVPCRGAPPGPTDCLAYLPNATIAWRWDVQNGPPSTCEEHRSGTLAAGAANDLRNANGASGVPLSSQVLVLTSPDPAHFRYWAAGAWYLPERMKCGNPVQSVYGLPAYFNLSSSAQGSGAADAGGNTCSHTTWLIDATADTIVGSCYEWNNAGSSMKHEWSLKRSGNATGR